ncbi:TetR/AcrR family transcriptional regulator [Actinomadura fibrosa]|uniref:TetR/AcrR family transcriptional regulator n=1 Tax=Actinomadura fibrosa TaxID=111802 RepID=A0ABW2XJF0_9ACTN|nr:TetR/AcrR family transcriptional regulator [Actinomadura fibrosa]
MSPRRRQEDRTRETRAALIAAGRGLFAEHGYADVTAEQIVAEAGLTRGALRHHFGDKAALFRAVFVELEKEIADRIAAAVLDVLPDPSEAPAEGPPAGQGGAWDGLRAGLAAFLDVTREPEVLRIGLTDAPAVLGWADWRAIEAEYGLGLTKTVLAQAIEEGVLVPQPVDLLAHLLLSAMIEAALLIARADEDDRARTREEAERTLLALLEGLRPPAPVPGRSGAPGPERL